MEPLIVNHWSIWQGVRGILLSDENKKVLRQFEDVDACVNWLYVHGFLLAARKLHNHAKN